MKTVDHDADNSMAGHEYVWSKAPLPVPILTDLMIAWTIKHGSHHERFSLVRRIRAVRDETIAKFYEPRLLPSFYMDESHETHC